MGFKIDVDKLEEEINLPNLVGDRIDYAREIRAQWISVITNTWNIDGIKRYVNNIHDVINNEDFKVQAMAERNIIFGKTDAAWWIENRDAQLRKLPKLIDAEWIALRDAGMIPDEYLCEGPWNN